MVLSRYPIVDSHYHLYTVNGKWYTIWHGDYLGGKGIGLVRIKTHHGLVDVYMSHLHAKYTEANIGDLQSHPEDEYRATRLAQAWELSRFIQLTARSPLVIVSIDANSPAGSPCCRLQRLLTGLRDAWAEGHAESDDGFTVGTIGNTWSSADVPARIDYQLFSCGGDGGAASAPSSVVGGRWRLGKAWVEKTYTGHNAWTAAVSVSDHFGVAAEYHFGEIYPSHKTRAVRATMLLGGIAVEDFHRGAALRTSLRNAVAKKLEIYPSDVVILQDEEHNQNNEAAVAVRLEIKSASEEEASQMARWLNREASSLNSVFVDCAKEQGWVPRPKFGIRVSLLGNAVEGTVGSCQRGSAEEVRALLGGMREDVEVAAEETLRRSRRHLLYAILVSLGGLMALNAPQYKVVTAFWSWIGGFMVAVQLSLWIFHTTTEMKAFRQIGADMKVYLRNIPVAPNL